FDFTNSDLLVRLARKYGIRLYPIIGFQWPPRWMDREHLLGLMPKKSGEPANEISSLMNYADPFVLDRFSKVIEAVVSRYKGDPAIAAWVLGNEFGYVEYVSGRQLGYDLGSLSAFRRF